MLPVTGVRAEVEWRGPSSSSRFAGELTLVCMYKGWLPATYHHQGLSGRRRRPLGDCCSVHTGSLKKP
jgi:hypothetical protein